MRNKTEIFAELGVLVQRISRHYWQPEGLNGLYCRYYQLLTEIMSNSLTPEKGKSNE